MNTKSEDKSLFVTYELEKRQNNCIAKPSLISIYQVNQRQNFYRQDAANSLFSSGLITPVGGVLSGALILLQKKIIISW